MKDVNHPGAGVLSDFGDFCINPTKPETMNINGYRNTTCLEKYDIYLGIAKLMPYPKGASARPISVMKTEI